MKASVRYRLNTRLPDKEGKYRDEQTFEVCIEVEAADYFNMEKMEEEPRRALLEVLTGRAKVKADSIRESFYTEAARLGAADYQEHEEAKAE